MSSGNMLKSGRAIWKLLIYMSSDFIFGEMNNEFEIILIVPTDLFF